MRGLPVASALAVISFLVSGCTTTEPQSAPDRRDDAEAITQEPPGADNGVVLSPSKVTLSLEVVHPIDGEQILSGAGGLGADAALIEIDGTKAPNAAGFFGHHDSFEVVYIEGGLLAQVLPEERWLSIPLEEASPFIGADIARLRDLSLINPLLLSEAISQAPETAGSITIDSEDSSVVATLDELYGIEELVLSVEVDSERRITEITAAPIYEIVRDTEATVPVKVVWTFQPLDRAPQVDLPPQRVIDDL